MLTDQIIAILVIHQRGKVDRLRNSHGDTESATKFQYQNNLSVP